MRKVCERLNLVDRERERESVCVCLCVCEGERERVCVRALVREIK